MYGKDSDGTGRPVLVDTDGRLIASGGGSYKENTLKGTQFFANALDMEVALYTATSAVGLIIYNPPLSGVNLVWNKWVAQVYAASIAMTGVVLAVGAQPTTPTGITAAPLTGGSLLSGSTSASLSDSKASAYSIATIIAPVLVWPLFTNTVTIGIVGTYMTEGDLQGAFASGPGTCTVIGALAAAGVNVNLGIGWEEVAV